MLNIKQSKQKKRINVKTSNYKHIGRNWKNNSIISGKVKAFNNKMNAKS